MKWSTAEYVGLLRRVGLGSEEAGTDRAAESQVGSLLPLLHAVNQATEWSYQIISASRAPSPQIAGRWLLLWSMNLDNVAILAMPLTTAVATAHLNHL